MTFLKGYILTITTMMILFSLSLNLAPENENKKTLRLAIGIVSALIIISPFFKMEGEKISFDFISPENLVDYDMAENMERRTLKTIELEIESRMETVIHKKCKVSLSSEGIIEKAEIENGTPSDKELLAQTLGIDPKAIICY